MGVRRDITYLNSDKMDNVYLETSGTIKLNFNNKEYNIEYIKTKFFLTFKDMNGARISFIKSENGLSIYVSDEYSKGFGGKKYPNLKGTNAYTLAKEQIKILTEWMNEE